MPVEHDYDDDARDAVLFRFWIRMASEHPGAAALALTLCRTPQDYRKALAELAVKFRINLP